MSIVKTLARVEWYLKEVVPLFLIGTALMFTLDRTGMLEKIIRLGEPLVTGWLGLPAQASAAFLVGFLRRDFGATGLFLMQSDGLLTPIQVVVAMVTITLFIPCIASVMMIARESNWRNGTGHAGADHPAGLPGWRSALSRTCMDGVGNMSNPIFLTCPLCGHDFEAGGQAACQACPMHRGCNLVCCPACGYQMVDERRSLMGRLAGSVFRARHPRLRREQQSLTLMDVPPGWRAKVVGFRDGIPSARRAHLQAYGLVSR